MPLQKSQKGRLSAAQQLEEIGRRRSGRMTYSSHSGQQYGGVGQMPAKEFDKEEPIRRRKQAKRLKKGRRNPSDHSREVRRPRIGGVGSRQQNPLDFIPVPGSLSLGLLKKIHRRKKLI
jgi:hypothetical protein